MADKKIRVDLDLNQNELQNAVIQNLASAPSNPKEGQIYYNTANDTYYGYKNGSWVALDSQGLIYSAGTGIDSSALSGGTIQVSTTIASKTDIGSANLTIQRNGTNIGTFSANATSAVTVNVSVPTTASEVGALPSTTTITDLADTTQMSAINSGVTASTVSAVASNTSGISAINSLIPSGTTASNQLVNKSYVDTEDISLQNQIDNLKARGRFLALWNCATGLAETNPPQSPYTYQAGDYFIVGVVSTANPAVNYKPNGSSYTTGVASTTVETEVVDVDDVYYYDGTNWKLQINTQKTVSFSSLAGSPYDNTNLSNALNAKQDELTAGSNISISGNTISATNTTYSNGSGLSLTGTTFAVDFTAVATAAQGAKADTAVQVYSASNPALTQSGGVCTWTVTHNLGTRDVEVKVYEISTWEEVICSVALTSTNAVTIKLNSTSDITAAEYQAVVAGH